MAGHIREGDGLKAVSFFWFPILRKGRRKMVEWPRSEKKDGGSAKGTAVEFSPPAVLSFFLIESFGLLWSGVTGKRFFPHRVGRGDRNAVC